MTPFVEVPVRRDPDFVEETRTNLLAQPEEFFRSVFEGRVPSEAEKIAWTDNAVRLMTPDRSFRNDTYEVHMHLDGALINLDIRRHDGAAVTNWRDFQTIKNEIVGPEHEAIELFPAESRLVDTANQYHLWVFPDAASRFPIGWWKRCVLPKPATIPTDHSGQAVQARQSVPTNGGMALSTRGMSVSIAI